MISCIADVLTPEEIKQFREVAGGAQFVDGKETAGPRAKRVKNNEQISKNDQSRRKLQEMVVAALYRHPEFRRVAMPHRIRPPLISRYKAGMAYGLHVDDALMGPLEARDRSDLSITVFISDVTEYEGGALVIHSPYGKQEIKLPAGHLVSYPSNSLHEVTPVTSGERLVSVTWVQSYVRDEKQREALADLATVRNKLSALVPNAPETDLAFRLHTNLTRMWSDT